MNNNQINKLKLFAQSLKNRHEEAEDFFVELSIDFVSGKKTFEASFGEKLYYNKEYYTLSFSEAIDFITKEAVKYDALTLTYKERGTKIVIKADNKNVTIKQSTIEDAKAVGEVKGAVSGRERYIKASQASELLKEIGILSKDGKIKNDMIRKYNQIDHFIEVIAPIIDALPKDKPINILDCACGKSYLTFVLNYYIKDQLKRNCYFIGVDYNEQVIVSSKERAKRLGYKNMEFVEADLNFYEPDINIDLLVSLHACDNATDFAIAAGIRLEAKSMIVVPCCHKEFIAQIDNADMNPLFKNNIFKVRFNDMFTDALRSLYLEARGYEVSALEYISPLDTPKNIMIRAIKKQDYNASAMQEYQNIKKMFNVNPIMEKL